MPHRKAFRTSIGLVPFCTVAAMIAFAPVAQAQSQPQTNPAQTNPASDEKGAFSILFENDLFDNTDHDYTNGVELGYTTSPNGTPQWAVNAARALPFFAQTGDVRTRYAIGQAIFTPTTITVANPAPTERPYAGFLYGSMGLVADDGVNLDQLQVTLGVVGPASAFGRRFGRIWFIASSTTSRPKAGAPSCATSPA